MSDFKNKAITSKGLELLSKAITGGQLTFTRIEMGNGVQDKDPVDVERLVNVKQNLQITSINRKGSQVTLSSTLKLEDVKEEYDWTELGVYAKGDDNKEVLYLYGYTENSSFISPTSLNEKLIHVTILVSNATEVSAIIDNSLIYLSQAEMDVHNDDEAAHKPLREWVQGLFDSLKLTWGNIVGKPETFPPSSHSHSKNDISDLPTSFPANGGNSDTVDGVHFHPRVGLDNKGTPYAYLFNGGDDENCYVYPLSSMSVGNADTVDGKHASSFATFDFLKQIGVYGGCQHRNNVSLNTLKEEGLYFVFNVTDKPSGFDHGFLDVSYFAGAGFSPDGAGLMSVHKQTLTSYDTGRQWTRMILRGTKFTPWIENGGESMYLKPSATLQYATGTHAISGKYVYGGDNTYKKIGQLHLPCAGTVKVVVTTTRTGTIETGSDSFWSSITFVDNAGGSLDSSGNGTNYSVGKMKFDYANMANGTSVTDNFYDSYDGPNTYTIQSDIKTLTANQTKTETFYVTFDKGGLFTLMSTVRVSSSTNSGSATANVKADFYWEVVN